MVLYALTQAYHLDQSLGSVSSSASIQSAISSLTKLEGVNPVSGNTFTTR
jgi:hypothetical protein